jgi:hypothetical protein
MNKYYLCEFHEQNGEFEYTHHHVYSDKVLKNMKVKIDDKEQKNNDVKLLNHFFGNISKDDKDGDAYWTYERLVSYTGFEEVKENELKTLEKGYIYCD